MDGWLVTMLGTFAGLCTTGSFVPQALKAWREGDTSAISKRMYLITITGFVLWISYGFVIRSWPIVIFNVISLLLGGYILALKLRAGDDQHEAGEAPGAAR